MSAGGLGLKRGGEPGPARAKVREPKGFVEMVRKANAPPPPEDSLLFRIVTLISVLSGVFACTAVGELSLDGALLASLAISAGMTFSALTRRRPWQWVKLVLALAVLLVFVGFVVQLFAVAKTGELTSIELPLAGLFVWVQVVHAFDVPARRDLLFSIAAAAALITVAGAQAESVGFLVYVAIWLVSSIVGLACSWRSMAGGEGRLRFSGLVGATILVLAVAVVLEAVLPAPRASQSIKLPSSLTSFLPLPTSGGLTQGNGSNPTEPAQAGRPGGVGGYVGMSGPLDTALRGSLGNQVVLRVRADRPGYFLGLTYDHWDGQSWTNSGSCQTEILDSGSPFDVSSPPRFDKTAGEQTTNFAAGDTNIQTFYVEEPLPNLLFATSTAEQVYFPSHSLALGCDNSIRSTVAMTPGTVYTVISIDSEKTPSQLANEPADIYRHDKTLTSYLSSDLALPTPSPYVRVAALARSIVAAAHPTSLVGIVQALETWMGTHTEYSTDIPALPAGEDAVNSFLFVTRKGFCEQISTALAVMLRTLGIPAREATGYVPGPFDPLSDLYTIEAKDAHAWVQVYFPNFGWQSFDPTTYVPLAPADPGAVLLSDLGHFAAGLPWVPIGLVGGGVVAVYGGRVSVRRRRARPKSWAGRLALRLELIGAGAGLARRAPETLSEYVRRLATATEGAIGVTPGLAGVVDLVHRSAYAGVEPSDAEMSAADSLVAQLRAVLRQNRRGRLRRRLRPRPL